jgi:hypothetical protein
MPRLLVGLLALVALSGMGCGLTLMKVPLRNYLIIRHGGDMESKTNLHASRIESRGACILFYRGRRLDTILCSAPFESVTVTEEN